MSSNLLIKNATWPPESVPARQFRVTPTRVREPARVAPGAPGK